MPSDNLSSDNVVSDLSSEGRLRAPVTHPGRVLWHRQPQARCERLADEMGVVARGDLRRGVTNRRRHIVEWNACLQSARDGGVTCGLVPSQRQADGLARLLPPVVDVVPSVTNPT